jgi:hypothetical protein
MRWVPVVALVAVVLVVLLMTWADADAEKKIEAYIRKSHGIYTTGELCELAKVHWLVSPSAALRRLEAAGKIVRVGGYEGVPRLWMRP